MLNNRVKQLLDAKTPEEIFNVLYYENGITNQETVAAASSLAAMVTNLQARVDELENKLEKVRECVTENH